MNLCISALSVTFLFFLDRAPGRPSFLLGRLVVGDGRGKGKEDGDANRIRG